MSTAPHRAGPDPEPIAYESEVPLVDPGIGGSEFDPLSWQESRTERASAGGRAVLGWALGLLAALWLGFSAWSAGRVLADEPLASPALAQWAAIAAGPLALLGLVWLMFGRTRRKEAEHFTRSVIKMRSEANALQDVLAALSSQIDRNHAALGMMAGDLMELGDKAASRLGGVTAEMSAGAASLARHGEVLDRAASAALADIGILLTDLPEAEAITARMADTLRTAGRTAIEQSAGFEAQVRSLTARTAEADSLVHDAAQRLIAHLTHIESAGAAAAAQVSDAANASSDKVDQLLARSAEALDQIRGGIDIQASAVAALLSQAGAGIGRAGIEASDALASRLDGAGQSLDALSERIAEQERASRSLLDGLGSGLEALDERFAALAASGDERAERVGAVLAALRGQIAAMGSDAGAQDQAILAIADRTQALREGVAMLSSAIATELNDALEQAEAGAGRLLATSSDAHPLILGARDAAVEASERIAAGTSSLDEQQRRLAELLATVDSGIGGAEQRLAELGEAVARANADAERLSNETGPALVAALVQVREAAGHAAQRAQAAISETIPTAAAELGEQARAALEKAVREAVEERLAEVDRLASEAVGAARAASEQLTAQMLSIGQSAAALEAHIERSRAADRKDAGEEFARRVSLLMDSMNSASIDVQKILSDEVDEKAWNSYLKGNRGVFTRRAVRLIGGTESRALQAHYESDPEFSESVNRYVADFEAMLRRVLAERDGGMMAVTLMGSDMGKLYAALAQAIERRR